MNFRRKLKLLYKQFQRDYAKDRSLQPWLNLQLALSDFGLRIDRIDLIHAVIFKLTQAKGRHLKRIGQAAKKMGKKVDLYMLALASHNGHDLRDVPFDLHYRNYVYPHYSINNKRYSEYLRKFGQNVRSSTIPPKSHD